MEQVISATEARVHFGELLRRVAEGHQAVIVERDGKPQVVVLAVEEYERLKATQPRNDWRQTMEKAIAVADGIRARRAGCLLPDPTDVISEMREERDEQLHLP